MPTTRELLSFVIGVHVGHFWPQKYHAVVYRGDVRQQKAVNQSAPSPSLSDTVTSTAASPSSATSSLDTKMAAGNGSPWSWVWDVAPFQHTPHRRFVGKVMTDTFTPFHAYFDTLHDLEKNAVRFRELPASHWWLHYFEPYHNHLHRFRGAERVVVMEVGVQSGGKIGMLRNYLGPGLEYIGIDINPVVKARFETADWIHIEIGDSSSIQFLTSMKEKYAHVDIFIDDGGHTMDQQMPALEHMLPHVHREGVYLCEDLATSWWPYMGGVSNSDVTDPRFVNQTTVGLIHRMMDWLNANWKQGRKKGRNSRVGPGHNNLPPSLFPESWWQTVPQQVKHIHYYNQLVVFEKGLTYSPLDVRTVGKFIPYTSSNPKADSRPVNWTVILLKLANITNSPYDGI